MASKTGNAAKRADIKKSGGFERAAGTARFIVCNRGEHCYVHAANGQTTHTKVGSDVFMTETSALYAKAPSAVSAELAENEAKFPGKGWGAALDTLSVTAN